MTAFDDGQAETGMSRLRNTVIGLAIGEDDDAAFTREIAEQAATVTAWWSSGTGGEKRFEARLPTGPRSRRDMQRLVDDLGLPRMAASDVVVLYVTGHGLAGASGVHYLCLPETDEDRLVSTGYPTAELILTLLDSSAGHVLIIVNSCYAGVLAEELARLRKDLPATRRRSPYLGVFTTADFDERPYLREFATLLDRVDTRLRTTAGITTEFLTFEEFHAELAHAARDAGLLQPIKLWPRHHSGQPSPTLPNPGYRVSDDLVGPARRQVATSAGELAQLAQHSEYWIGRATGRPTDTDSGWYFYGRYSLTRVVADFLNRPGTKTSKAAEEQAVLIVTGAAGTGKSAVIARAVTLSDDRFRADPRFHQAIATAAPETVPAVGSIDVAVLARNIEATELLLRLITAIGENVTVTTKVRQNQVMLREQLHGLLLASGGTWCIVIDGLDEARHPAALIVDVVVPLAHLVYDDGRPVVRLIIGVRSTKPRNDSASDGVRVAEDGTGGLLDLLRSVIQTRPFEVVRTDGPTVTEDISGYVQALLDVPSSPYAGDAVARRGAAQIVARHVSPSFLDARLAAVRLRARSQRQRHDDQAWLATLDEGTLGLLREDLRAITAIGISVPHILAVLRAAAFSQGSGIPWAEIWPTVATALADPDDQIAFDPDRVIDHILRSRLAGFLTRDVEDDRVVYRLAHELLAKALRSQPGRLQDSADAQSAPQPQDEELAAHTRIAGQLAELARLSAARQPHPYLRRQLARHAFLSGVLDDRHVPATLLPYETSGNIRGLLGLPIREDPAGAALSAWACIEPFLGDADLTCRAVSLDFALLARGKAVPGLRNPEAVITPRWASWTMNPNVLFHHRSIGGATAFSGADGQTLLAIVVNDNHGLIKIFDPVGGMQTGQFDIEASYVTSTEFAIPDGRTLIALHGTEHVSGDGTVRIVDPLTGVLVAKFNLGSDGFLSVHPFTVDQGRPLLAVSWRETSDPRDKMVEAHTQLYVYDPLTGTQIAHISTGDRGGLSVRAFRAGGGRTLLAISDEFAGNGKIHISDPLSGVPLYHIDTGFDDGIGTAVFVGKDGQTQIAAKAWADPVRIFDPLTGTQTGQIETTVLGRTITPFTRPDGGAMLAIVDSRDSKAVVRILDPANGAEINEFEAGNPYQVKVMPFTAEHGRQLLAIFDSEGLHIVDPLSGDRLRTGYHGVASVIPFAGRDGRSLQAVITGDDNIQILDPLADPQPQAGPYRITGITSFTDPEDNLLLAALGLNDGRTVWIHDAMTGTQIRSFNINVDSSCEITRLTMANGRALLAASSHWSTNDGFVRILDPIDGVLVTQFDTGITRGMKLAELATLDGGTSLAVFPDGPSTSETPIRIFDPLSGEQVNELDVGHLRYASVQHFRTETGQSLLALAQHNAHNKLLLIIIDPADGTLVGIIEAGHPTSDRIKQFIASDGRTRLATYSATSAVDPHANSDGVVRIFDPATQRQVGHFETGHRGGIFVTAFTSGDGRQFLATAPTISRSPCLIQIFDPIAMTRIGALEVDAVFGCALIPFTTGLGRALVAIISDLGHDTTVRLMDPLTCDEIGRIVTGATIRTVHAYQTNDAPPAHNTFLAVGGTGGIAAFKITDANG